VTYGTYYLNASSNFKTTQKNLADKSNFKASSEPFTTAPAKVRETANSRKAGELSGLPPPAGRKPKPPVNAVMQRFLLRTETLPQPLPANPRTSVRISDNINLNSVAQRNILNMTNEPESSTMEASTPSGRSSSKTMPLPGSHGAPHFDKEKPIELLRFIEQMEDLFKEYAVSEDQAKKRYLGKYTDQKTEFEWRAFDTYDSSSSYEEFKAALIDDYPEAKMAGKGTLSNLRKICKEHQCIHIDDFAKLKSLTRSFKAEQKLLLKPPALVSNRELVDLFLGCLKEAFQTQVEHSLNIQLSKDSKKKSIDDDKAHRPEDPYDILEVIEMAESIAGRAQGATSLNATGRGVNVTEARTTREPHTHSTPTYNIKLEDDLRELNNKVALLMDKFTTSERVQQSTLQALKQEMNRLTDSLMHQHVATAPTARQTTQPTWKMGPDGCWYCEELGHFAMNCPH